jgi:hypothetical protein
MASLLRVERIQVGCTHNDNSPSSPTKRRKNRDDGRPKRFIVSSTRRKMEVDRPPVCRTGIYKHGELSLFCYKYPSITDVLAIERAKNSSTYRAPDENEMKGLSRTKGHCLNGRILLATFLVSGFAFLSMLKAVGAGRLRTPLALVIAILSAYLELNKYKTLFTLLYEYPQFQNEQELYSNYSINDRPFAEGRGCKLYFARHKKMGVWIVLKTVVITPGQSKELVGRIHALVSVILGIEGDLPSRHVLPIFSVYLESATGKRIHENAETWPTSFCDDGTIRLTCVIPYHHSSDLDELRLFREYFHEKEARAIGRQLFTALSLLHHEGIWHGSVCCADVLVSDPLQPSIYLTPFSLTSRTKPRELSNQSATSSGERKRFEEDLWNGVKLLYLVLCGEEYTQEANGRLGQSKELDPRFSFSPWQLHSKSSMDFFQQLERRRAEGALTEANVVLQHPWLQ